MRISESPTLYAPAHVDGERTANTDDRPGAVQTIVRRPNLIEVLDRRDRITTMATTDRGEHAQQAISVDGSVARGLLDREDLVQMLDRAVTKRVTVVSAPPGSGKTSLLRVWARRSTGLRRVAFVSVERDQQDAQRFWSAVLDAIRRPTSSVGPETLPAATASLDADELVDRILSELAEQVEPVVLVIDDVHELRSAEAFGSSSICSGFSRARRA